MKLWHDDVRPAPTGWTWARTNDEAKQHLETGDVQIVSLDHDLGYDGPPPVKCEDCFGRGKILMREDDPTLVPCPACDGDGFHGGDLMYVAGGSPNGSGYDLVCWMVQTGNVPSHVIVHSWNPVGAERMRQKFGEHGWLCVVRPYQLPAAA